MTLDRPPPHSRPIDARYVGTEYDELIDERCIAVNHDGRRWLCQFNSLSLGFDPRNDHRWCLGWHPLPIDDIVPLDPKPEPTKPDLTEWTKYASP